MIGKRFRAARNHRGFTLRDVGSIVGVSPQAVGQWEKTNPQFTAARGIMIANILQVDFDWLEGDIGNDEEIIFVNQNKDIQIEVPIVNKLEALTFSMFAAQPIEKQEFRKGSLKPSAKLLGRGFAFEMDDDSMYPMIRRDDILIFDPAARPTKEDIVFALVVGENGFFAPVIRMYENLGDGDFGGAKISLQALSEFHDSYTLNDKNIGQVFAVLVELRMVRPKAWRISSS